MYLFKYIQYMAVQPAHLKLKIIYQNLQKKRGWTKPSSGSSRGILLGLIYKDATMKRCELVFKNKFTRHAYSPYLSKRLAFAKTWFLRMLNC